MEDPQVSALRSPSQAGACLAEGPLIVDKTSNDQAAQVEMAPRPGTARAPIEDREPAPARERAPDDRDLKDANIRDGELDGSPLPDGLHAKDAGQRVVKGMTFEQVVEWLREVDEGSDTIRMLLDRLARYRGLVARLRLLLDHGSSLGLRDTDKALLVALLQQLGQLLAMAEEIRRDHTEMQRLAADLRTRGMRQP